MGYEETSICCDGNGCKHARAKVAKLREALQWVIDHDETTAYVQNKCAKALRSSQ